MATVYLSKLLVDSLVATVGAPGDWERVRPTLILAGMMVGRRDGAGGGAARRGRVGSHRAVRAGAGSHQRADPPSRPRWTWRSTRRPSITITCTRPATRPAPGRALIESLGSLVQNGIAIVAMAGVLLPYGLWLPLALFASTLPALAVVARHTLRNYQWSKQTTLERRRHGTTTGR